MPPMRIKRKLEAPFYGVVEEVLRNEMGVVGTREETRGCRQGHLGCLVNWEVRERGQRKIDSRGLSFWV